MRKINKGLFTSNTGKWNTPQDLVSDLATVFDWDCDVCASTNNVCDYYFDEEENGLAQQWQGLCWMNPPYGREISKWVRTARVRAGFGSQYTFPQSAAKAVVCLLPARTDTQWWQDNVPFASQIVFIKGRLKFGDAENSAPFPSAFVVFGELNEVQRSKLSSYGWDVRL